MNPGDAPHLDPCRVEYQERRHPMGEKGSKKDKAKAQKQKQEKAEKKKKTNLPTPKAG